MRPSATWRITCYDENATRPKTLQEILGLVQTIDGFLSKIKTDHPAAFEPYLEALQSRLQAVNGSFVAKLPPLNMELTTLADHPQLVDLLKSSLLVLHNQTHLNSAPLSASINLTATEALSGMALLHYYTAKALEAIMPRDEVIAYAKTLAGFWIDQQADASWYREDLDDHIEKVQKGLEAAKSHDLVAFRYLNQYFGLRFDRCRVAEILREVDDRELAEAIWCHADYRAIHHRNPNFVFTRTGTLVQGKPYCDFFVYDRRATKAIEHPPKEFWDNL